MRALEPTKKCTMKMKKEKNDYLGIVVPISSILGLLILYSMNVVGR